MHLRSTIFIVKESRNGEQRVALVPSDVLKLIQDGFKVLVEDQAGIGAGFTNRAYESIGAKICKIQTDCVESYRAAFKNVDMIIRVKRPDRAREKLEALAIQSGTNMIGSLDLLEKNSEHVNEYQHAEIVYHSFDQFHFAPDTPMNAIKKMSAFAGKLALDDAILKLGRIVEKVVVIGYGEAGKAVYAECLRRGLLCFVLTGQLSNVQEKGTIVYISREISLPLRQEFLKKYIKDADIVITTASSNGELAPILITNHSLSAMKKGAVIVDLAVPEGGNVEGSRPDATVVLGNDIQVINVSGYPKAVPTEASVEWSKASYYFINLLVKTPELLKRRDS